MQELHREETGKKESLFGHINGLIIKVSVNKMA